MGSSADLQNVLNFRDVGKTVNEYLGRRLVREGLLYRSARLDDATLDDREHIRDVLDIRTVIDLRTNITGIGLVIHGKEALTRNRTEHLTQAKKRDVQQRSPTLLKTNPALAEPLHIDGLEYHEIKLTGRPFELFLLKQLSWWDLLLAFPFGCHSDRSTLADIHRRFLCLFVCGYRMQAISIIGQNVMLPRGLVGLGLDTLDQSTAEIRQTLSLYTTSDALPSVVHCTQGKDRTGLIISLVLMILGVPIPAIEYDYSLTDAALIPEREERLVEIHEIGLTDDWADTASDMISRTEQHLDDTYGGLSSYLDHIRFGEEDRAKVRDLLLY